MRADLAETLVETRPANTAFRADVLAGLALPQKAVPARWFYDEAGSLLFEEITRLPEYYPTRVERAILAERGTDFARLIAPGRAVVEFGSGSSTKTPLLLQAIAPAAYVPLDISGDFLRSSAAQLQQQFPDLPVWPVEADFTAPVTLPARAADLPKIGFFPGSTIGNMVPAQALDLLRSMRSTLGPRSQLLIGMDLIKDPAMLIAAYDDAAGVTARFNLNLAARINRELGGTLPLDALRHEARWNDAAARIEMHLVASAAIRFEVAGQAFTMAEGETIHTENSHKYDRRSQNLLLAAGGWRPVERWTDQDGQFSLLLAEAAEAHHAP
ncbi:L-histidine N(alpha)-methyltransferase [Croceibacterium ferulae]|uniref:L-histidine N(alpha)-methyltransferase n=1 Tax=Croceibacterium ferulae TaxID=1854641 RepID=UPI001F4DF77C|nr:L-histidine N(alpha)-methyltransferase [Croceibacterium ferulae]